MFDWLGDIISGIGDVINSTVETLGQKVSNAIFDSLLQWYYESIYNAIADFFAMMGIIYAVWLGVVCCRNGCCCIRCCNRIPKRQSKH